MYSIYNLQGNLTLWVQYNPMYIRTWLPCLSNRLYVTLLIFLFVKLEAKNNLTGLWELNETLHVKWTGWYMAFNKWSKNATCVIMTLLLLMIVVVVVMMVSFKHFTRWILASIFINSSGQFYHSSFFSN